VFRRHLHELGLYAFDHDADIVSITIFAIYHSKVPSELKTSSSGRVGPYTFLCANYY
jgi:hypothetical protein